MQQKLTAALQTLYSTRKDAPHLIRMMMQMSDPIDRAVLRSAVDVTMQRYPYFCVELRKNDGQYVFEHNTRPVVISDTLGGTELNSESFFRRGRLDRSGRVPRSYRRYRRIRSDPHAAVLLLLGEIFRAAEQRGYPSCRGPDLC